jgi:hypothetical protein
MIEKMVRTLNEALIVSHCRRKLQELDPEEGSDGIEEV